ncbi:hypothetical protein [Kosakonia sp. Marseille-Q7440]
MFSLLTGVPGLDDLRGVARRIDTARHHGVPNGVILELDLQELPHETEADLVCRLLLEKKKNLQFIILLPLL